MVQKLVLVYIIFLVYPTISQKVYRSDYEYNRRTDAFYKLHIESSHYIPAQRMCEVEGAVLMVPGAEDIVQLHSMFKAFPDLGDIVWVADDGQPHDSAEEPAIIELSTSTEPLPSTYYQCDVVTRDGEIRTAECYQSLPFICKVAASDAPYDSECDVYGRGYQKFENVSSCYKIPSRPYTWNQAYAECAAEGAHLVVINSQAEHDVVQQLINTSPKVNGAKTFWFFYAGFRAQPTTDGSPRVFRTIFNQTLEEAGYSTWADHVPNNSRDNEYCGTIFKNDGKFNDVNCLHEYAFICEKELTK